VAALDSLPGALNAARALFDAFAPERSIPALVTVHRLLSRICDNEPFGIPCAEPASDGLGLPGPAGGYLAGSPPGGVAEGDIGRARGVALARVQRALQLASGVVVEAIARRELWSIDAPYGGSLTVYNRGRLPVQVAELVSSHPSYVTILPDSSRVFSFTGRPIGRPTAPWWLSQPRRGAMFANLRLRGDEAAALPDHESREAFETTAVGVRVEGADIGVRVPVVYRFVDQVLGEVRRPIAGVPAVSVRLEQEVEYAPARAPIERELRVHLWQADTTARVVQVTLRLPSGLRTDSSTRSVTLPPGGAARTVPFRVRGTLAAGRHVIDAVAIADGQEYSQGYTTIDYEHITPRRMYRPSRLTIEAVDVTATSNMRVGYIQGVGDNSMPALEQLGIAVTRLNPATLGSADLRGYSAIVVGPRAYESFPALVANNARLLDYARAGGTLVVQYGQYEMQQPGIMPYPVTINRPHDRVTNENAPVTIIDSTASVLRTPNRITARDFEGWIQDRSLYMARTFDSTYVPILEMSDPGEPARRGALLVAPLGQGTYVYTTLAFFRQLPNGVPGAARLFVNLLAAKAGRVAQ
jgi:hypothetical protein